MEGIWKVHIFRHLFVCFQTSVYTLGDVSKNRNNSTVFEELSFQLWIWRSQLSVLLPPLSVASKTAFATIKSTIDTSNSSQTVLLFLNYILFFIVREQLPRLKSGMKKRKPSLSSLNIERDIHPRFQLLSFT